MMSETCVHDTIPICGKMGDEKRTFLDLCDLLEYACDTNQSMYSFCFFIISAIKLIQPIGLFVNSSRK